MVEDDQDQMLGTTIGERLIDAREAKGMSLEDVASQTRIPIRHLQHIERGEWESLPAVTYSIGFARAYAKAVDLDGPAIALELRNQLGAGRSIGAAAPAYYEPADPARVPPRSVAIVAGLIALLLVIGYMLWRNSAVQDGPVAVESEVVEGPAATPQAAAPSPLPAAPAAAGGAVVLTAAEDVWLRVYEGGTGQTLFQGTLKGGDRYEVPAAVQAPQIRTGRPNALRVSVGATQVPPLGPPERTIRDVSLRAADLVARGQAAPAGQLPVPAPPPAAANPLED